MNEDPNSSSRVEERKNQEDPIVMYLIVNETLGMGIGKTAAQCAHASQMLTLKYFEMKEESKPLQKKAADPSLQRVIQHSPGMISIDPSIPDYKGEYAKLSGKISIFGEWMASSFRKVVLKADNKEWAKLKEEFKDSMVLVVDAGLTQIAPGSETCIGLWPMRKSKAPKVVQRLQVLK